jgi:hypothetical protein
MKESSLISIIWKIVSGKDKKEALQKEIELEYNKSQIQTLPPSIRNSHKLEYLQLNAQYLCRYGCYYNVPNNHDKNKRTI